MINIILILLCTKNIFLISIKPKLCIDCKFFRKNFFTPNKYGKCSLFPIEKDNQYFLVDGNNNNKTEYYYCSTSRKYENMCGSEGKLFVKK